MGATEYTALKGTLKRKTAVPENVHTNLGHYKDLSLREMGFILVSLAVYFSYFFIAEEAEMKCSCFVHHKPCFAIPSHVGVARPWVRLKAPPEVASNTESY